jgi:hemerythrin
MGSSAGRRLSSDGSGRSSGRAHRFERAVELRETHLSIRTTVRWLGAELDPVSTPALLDVLRALASDLERHFALEERGVFPFARRREPPAPDELERWRAEHRALSAGLREIRAELERAVQTTGEVPVTLRPTLRSWLAMLARHEEAESSLGGI